MRNILLLLALLILVVPLAHALSISMGEAKVILRENVPDGQTVTIDRSIRLKNPNDIPVKVNLEPVGGYKKIIELAENDFIMQPNESKRAEFKIVLKSGGRYEGRILVSFSSTEPKSKEIPVGFSSTIVIIANGTVTQDYYDVMNSTETNGDDPYTEEESYDEDTLDEPDQEEPDEGFSLDLTPEDSDDEIDEGEEGIKAKGLIGILLVIIILILIAAIVWVIRRLLK